ncbi:MAG: hypothetical protein ABJN57_11350 [Hyphomicrobiales bacterium]
MAKRKASLVRSSTKLHKWLGWTGGLALLFFAISGITHPLMTWTGPKAASFFPPQVKVSSEHAAQIPKILKKNNIDRANMAKIIPSKDGALLQVTQSNEAPRRYFDLATGVEKLNYDQKQAIWLARYYSGLKSTPIKSITFQTEFSSAYPWVNRLLPVYRVEFEIPDSKTTFIYTELGALAGITNNWKTSVQSVFRTFHSWAWLDDFEYARVFLMMMFLLSLLGMAITGIALIFMIKKRSILDGRRKWHRALSFAIWLPLFLFTASGIYHLLHSSFGDNHRGLKLGQPIDLSASRFGENLSWLEEFKGKAFNSLSLVEGITNGAKTPRLLYRISIPKGKPGQAVSRSKRFKGMATEKQSFYFDALTGEKAKLNDKELNDKDMALYIAKTQLGFSAEQLQQTKLVTHFGPHYDFRNKRLPVWRLDFDTPKGDKLFIDPATGMLVDRLVNLDRYEGYSFSLLHKWNFLAALIGREKRDIVISVILIAAIGFTFLGYLMLFKRRRSSS